MRATQRTIGLAPPPQPASKPGGKANGRAGGREIYLSACAACHGADGRGASDKLRGFEKPATFPDFTECRATARESDVFWGAILHNGGPGRGFSEIMPSFREALTDDEITRVMSHVRRFCREPAWPRVAETITTASKTRAISFFIAAPPFGIQ